MKINHLAVIMDGNGRWAKSHNLPIHKGHQKGSEKIEELCENVANNGIKYLTIFAFSTENWKRSTEEINHLLKLIKFFYSKKLNKLVKDNVNVKILGFDENVPSDIKDLFLKMEEKTKDNDGLYLNIAFNYGSRKEIVNSVNEFIKNNPNKLITEKDVNENLFTKNMPDVDLLIRTSGEQRISNFLLWQIAYSELVFSDVFWPDFNAEELDKCIEEYYKRNRRFGGR